MKMIEEIKNKPRLSTKSKILVLGLILIVVVGLFSPEIQVNAQGAPTVPSIPVTPLGPTLPGAPVPAPTAAATPDKPKSDFEQQFDTAVICRTGTVSIDVGGCLVSISYYLFYVVPSLLLIVSANFFNAIIAISLSSTLFAKSTFIPTAWAVVRDLSNLFFILILLYIALQIILDLGHDAKKMIVKVIIIALLINFSMFFTQVVIDSSNILALIFYNKLEVDTKKADGSTRDYTKITKEGIERDLSGAMVDAFNPTSQLTWNNFFKAARDPAGQFTRVGTAGEKGECWIKGIIPLKEFGLWTKDECTSYAKYTPSGTDWYSVAVNTNPDKSKSLAQIPSGIMLGLILVTGAVMLFASYCFFVAGVSFMGRFIELWILIIFSPFAMMSYSVPFLEKVEYIGWDNWLKRLFAVSFMAPIFMFFLYFIFLLLKEGLFGNLINGEGIVETMLLIVIPAMIILILLLQATKFAKKGSGAFGEILMTGTKLVGGLALGAATGGAAMLGTRAIGGLGGAGLNKAAAFAESKGFGRVGGRLRDVSDFARKSSFDVRGVKIGGKTLAGATGMNLGEAGKGGWSEMKKRQVEKRQKRADVLEKRGTGKEKKAVDAAEIDIKEAVLRDATVNGITLPVKLHLENADKEMDKARKELSDAKLADDGHGSNAAEITAAKTALDAAKAKKDAARAAVGLPALEKIRDRAKVDLDVASDKITTDYAKAISGGLSKGLNMFFRAGAYSIAGADEAARKIRTGTKLDSGEKPH